MNKDEQARLVGAKTKERLLRNLILIIIQQAHGTGRHEQPSEIFRKTITISNVGVKLFNWGKQYAQFRPTYPDSLYRAIWNYSPTILGNGTIFSWRYCISEIFY